MATFGKTTNGTGSSNQSSDLKTVSFASPQADGIIQSMTWRGALSAPGSTNMRGIIYSDLNGAPNQLLAMTEEVTVSNTAEQDITADFPELQKFLVTKNTPYWIGFHLQDPGAINWAISRDALSNHRYERSDAYADGPSQSYGAPAALSGPIDAYVTCEPVVDIPKTYRYDVYNGTDYVGTLNPKTVSSEFVYSQLINTAGAQLEIKLATRFEDIGAELETDLLVDEDGNYIVDELGNNIILGTRYDFENVPIALGNRVIATCFYNEHPNGLVVFDGIITNWAADFENDTVAIQVDSHGIRLDNYIIDTDSDVGVVQETYNQEWFLSPADPVIPEPDKVAQTFQLATSALLQSISVPIRRDSALSCVISLEVYEGTPASPGALIAQVSERSITNQEVQFVEIALTSPVALAASTEYHFVVTNVGQLSSSWAFPYIAYQDTDVYASGQMYTNQGGAGWIAQTYDLGFRLNTSSGSVGGAFSIADPANIVRTALDIFNAKGGLVTYSADSIDNTGVAVDYDFKLGTVQEAIKKALELSPNSWYWYANPADNLVYFKQLNTAADHLLIKGNHISGLKLERSIQEMVNAVYFSGGDTGSGENLFIKKLSASSIAQYGQWLSRISDNRVTQEDTATKIALSEMNQTPEFRSDVVIPCSVYDTESIKPGETVGFAGFGNLADTLRLQIVGLRRTSYTIELTLGSLPPRQTAEIDKIKRGLVALETIDNPDVASEV